MTKISIYRKLYQIGNFFVVFMAYTMIDDSVIALATFSNSCIIIWLVL